MFKMRLKNRRARYRGGGSTGEKEDGPVLTAYDELLAWVWSVEVTRSVRRRSSTDGTVRAGFSLGPSLIVGH